MCNHTFLKMNDVTVCVKCGMTVADGKKVIFDRKLPSYIRKKNRRKKK